MTEQVKQIEIPAGVLAITTYGSVTGDTVQSLLNLRGYNTANGINNIHYQVVPGGLVDKARNEAARMVIANAALKYVLFVDADMQFAQDSVHRLLITAYSKCPWADAVGAYCQLRGSPYLTTLDTGTGTWEPIPPGQGPLEVIRTGGAFILIKRHVFEALEFPWYGVRPAPRPIDALLEVDNFARCKHDGRNPLRDHPFWEVLERCAKQDAAAKRTDPNAQQVGGYFSSVGEDSNFTDKMKALGFRVVVDTDLVIGHLDKQVIVPEMHLKAMKESEHMTKLAVGMGA